MKFSTIIYIINCSISWAAALKQYEIAVQAPQGEICSLGTLDLNPAQAAPVVQYIPSELKTEQLPRDGCIGFKTFSSFDCQVLYKDISFETHSAIRVLLGPDGTPTQVQLTEGDRNQTFIEVPHVVQRPELKKGGPKAIQKGQTVREARKSEKEEAEEQSFLEKYWIYMIPAGFLLITNVMGRSNA